MNRSDIYEEIIDRLEAEKRVQKRRLARMTDEELQAELDKLTTPLK